MNYDRPVIIMAAGSHSGPWKPQNIMVSEFIARLRTPARSPETLAQYRAMPKSQQDALKDAGGYVAGSFSGSHRKAGAMISRWAATLDADNIPAGGTDDVLRRVDGLGCGYVLHSTRKHSPSAPRQRVIIPFNRDVTPDEYEPIARRLAEWIGMELFDPSTFEPSRLMYWPSCCADSQYVYNWVDRPFIDADAMLRTYTDWHNITEWPICPGEQKRIDADLARTKRQADPESKGGGIGTFCRLYPVHRVIAELIPGVYTPCDGDRYTYARGSTTGGAVVYDNGKFLFSHHATDPAGGKLCNAFDLCRIHRFGELDDSVPEGAFGNQLPSFKAMKAYAENLPDVKQQMEEDRGKQVLEDFGNLSQQVENDPERKAAIGRLDGEPLTTALVKQVLSLLGITTRLNVISNEAEITGVPRSWSRENAVNNLPTLIRDFCRKAGVCGVSKEAICDSLASINDEARFNPVLDMLYSAPWDGADRLPVIYQILGVTDPFSQTLIKKWLWQCVAMSHNGSAGLYGADGVLTLTGPQGIGKTSFFRQLSADPALFVEGRSLNMTSKDTILEALRGWLTELGELDGTLKRDLPGLKAFITSARDILRAPYARSATDRPRHTSFCATVNQDDFLKDETGNRRFWTVPVKNVDLNLLHRLNATWMQQLWAQVLTLYAADHQGFRLTHAEQQQLERINAEHMQPLPYEEEVLNELDFGLPLDRWAETSAAQIAERIYPRPDCRRIGRVLAKLVQTNPHVEYHGRRNNTRVYLLPLKIYGLDIQPRGSANTAI